MNIEPNKSPSIPKICGDFVQVAEGVDNLVLLGENITEVVLSINPEDEEALEFNEHLEFASTLLSGFGIVGTIGYFWSGEWRKDKRQNPYSVAIMGAASILQVVKYAAEVPVLGNYLKPLFFLGLATRMKFRYHKITEINEKIAKCDQAMKNLNKWTKGEELDQILNYKEVLTIEKTKLQLALVQDIMGIAFVTILLVGLILKEKYGVDSLDGEKTHMIIIGLGITTYGCIPAFYRTKHVDKDMYSEHSVAAQNIVNKKLALQPTFQ